MSKFIEDVFSTSTFMPHGHCYLWNPGLVALHVGSDLLIALAYTSIPFSLVYFLRRRRDIPFRGVFWCFGIFIVACGATHYFEILTLWVPVYWLSGAVKALTAAASVPTAFILWRLVPKAVALPSPAQLALANQSLAVAEQRVRLLVENVRDYALFMLDCDGTVMSWNRGAERLKGYKPDEIIGRPYSIFFTPEDVASCRPAELIANALTLGRVEDQGWRQRKDGSRFWADAVLTPIFNAQDEHVGFAKITRDLTERRRAEEALLTANRELEAFSYSVAHDLRAPLRAMKGFAKILVEGSKQHLDASAHDCVQEIDAGADRMGAVIDALLALSRVSRETLKTQSIDLSLLAQSVVDQLAAADPSHRVEVVIQKNVCANMDPGLARVLLDNLLGNAWKFSSKRDAPRIELGEKTTPGEKIFFVRDNGAGFDMTRAEKLFTPFHRLHASTDYSGTGIGLATAQRIVCRHGGRLWAEAKPNEGATFFFTVGEVNAS